MFFPSTQILINWRICADFLQLFTQLRALLDLSICLSIDSYNRLVVQNFPSLARLRKDLVLNVSKQTQSKKITSAGIVLFDSC